MRGSHMTASQLCTKSLGVLAMTLTTMLYIRMLPKQAEPTTNSFAAALKALGMNKIAVQHYTLPLPLLLLSAATCSSCAVNSLLD